MSLLRTTALLASLATTISAHGYVQGIVAGGTYYTGYNPSFQYQDPAPVVIGWSDPEDLSNGYIAPNAYSDPDIICHLDATPAGTSAKVAAGDVVELQWTTWPDSHHGPVLDYLAKCDGDCSSVDKTTLEFFKIDEGGLVDGSSSPGNWASDQLIANNNSWAVTIPTGIAPGNYVLRHEIIALHSAGQSDGAQNYPQCINLEITGEGTDTPAGTLGTALYKDDDPGILINIYTALSTYTIPGPTLYSDAVTMAQTEVAIATAAPASTGRSTSYVAATTTAAASSYSSVAPYSNSSTSAVVAYSTSSSVAAAVSTSTPVVYSSASSSVAAPVSTSSPAPSASSTSCTTTLYQTITATEAATAATSSAAAYSAVASETSAAAASTSTSSTSGHTSSTGDDKPSKALPEGLTLQDLQEWVAYLLKKGWKEDGFLHSRDFGRVWRA